MLLLVPGDATDLFAASEYSPLATLEAELDVQTLDAFIADLSPCEVRLSLPQFRAASSLDLQASLKQLGIRQAFDSNAADFSRLTDESVFVGQAVHRAYIEIDESGTRAAAATGATIAGKSAGPQLPTIAFDQPFVFLIRDKLTESILFMGRVTDPTATGE
jgi:serpin B